MQLVVRSGYTWSTTITVNHLAKEDSSFFVFVNMKSKVNDIVKLTKTNIDIHSTTVTDNVLRSTGGMKKSAKYANIGIFTGKVVFRPLKPVTKPAGGQS